MISFFHQPDFSLGNFHNFRKKRQKSVVFLRLPPRRHLFQFFFRVSCNMSLGAISRVRVFIRKNDPFFNFCPFLTTPPRRHSNLTRCNIILSGQITMASRRKVKNGQKLKKRVVFLDKKSDR